MGDAEMSWLITKAVTGDAESESSLLSPDAFDNILHEAFNPNNRETVRQMRYSRLTSPKVKAAFEKLASVNQRLFELNENIKKNQSQQEIVVEEETRRNK